MSTRESESEMLIQPRIRFSNNIKQKQRQQSNKDKNKKQMTKSRFFDQFYSFYLRHGFMMLIQSIIINGTNFTFTPLPPPPPKIAALPPLPEKFKVALGRAHKIEK